MLKLIDKTRTASKFAAVALVSMLAAVVSPSVMAAAIDVDDVVTDIGAQLAPVAAIAGAVLLVFVALKAWKWIRRALS